MKQSLFAAICSLAILLGMCLLTAPAQAVVVCPTFVRTLAPGVSGEDVTVLQQFLKDNNYFKYPAPTGYFGPITMEAVIAYQTAHGIDPVGIVGPITRARIALCNGGASAVGQNATTTARVVRYSGGAHGDRTAPTAPGDLSSPDATITTIVLEWIASTDRGGTRLSGYRVERCEGEECDSFELIASPTETTFEDTGLAPETTYSYRVRAVDRVGNLSEYSSIIEVTTMDDSAVVTVTHAGAGSGTITAEGSDIDCGVLCSDDLAIDTTITLTATPESGSVFVGWAGGCSGTGTCELVVTEDVTVTAYFTQVHTLTVTKSGLGSGIVISVPSGISCGATCTASFASGQMVTVEANVALGSTFAGWSGACSGTGACVVTMSHAVSVTATFNEDA